MKAPTAPEIEEWWEYLDPGSQRSISRQLRLTGPLRRWDARDWEKVMDYYVRVELGDSRGYERPRNIAAMKKIASPNELQAELRSVMAFIQGHGPEGRPGREVIAAKLRDVADRVAARPRKPKLPKTMEASSSEVAKIKSIVEGHIKTLDAPWQHVQKLNDKLKGSHGVAVPMSSSYNGKASVQIGKDSALYQKGDGEASPPVVAYVVHTGGSTDIPFKNVKLSMKWTKTEKGYDIETKVV